MLYPEFVYFFMESLPNELVLKYVIPWLNYHAINNLRLVGRRFHNLITFEPSIHDQPEFNIWRMIRYRLDGFNEPWDNLCKRLRSIHRSLVRDKFDEHDQLNKNSHSLRVTYQLMSGDMNDPDAEWKVICFNDASDGDNPDYQEVPLDIVEQIAIETSALFTHVPREYSASQIKDNLRFGLTYHANIWMRVGRAMYKNWVGQIPLAVMLRLRKNWDFWLKELNTLEKNCYTAYGDYPWIVHLPGDPFEDLFIHAWNGLTAFQLLADMIVFVITFIDNV